MNKPWKLLLQIDIKANDRDEIIRTLQRITANLKEGKDKGEQWEHERAEFEWKVG